jgi:hypothetical protein
MTTSVPVKIRWSEVPRTIPRWAYVLTFGVWTAIQLAIHRAFQGESDPPHLAIQLIFGLYIASVFAPIILVAGIVHADSRKRGMNAVFWSILAVFLPGAGVLLYLLLRPPLPIDCQGCGKRLRHGGAYCPSCGEPVGRRCSECHREVLAGDAFCASCGRAVTARS